MSKSRALSESEPSISLRETKALNGDFLRLAPPAAALPHLGAVNRRSLTDSAPQCLQLFDYVPSRVRLKDFSTLYSCSYTLPFELGFTTFRTCLIYRLMLQSIPRLQD